MSEWQPIESAPKDGTLVLLVGGTTREDYYLEDHTPQHPNRPVVVFGEMDEWGEFSWLYCFWDGAWRSEYENPTHWQPLPEPPK